ncbi:hypothetical protein K501DRAFT_217548 [Backusella circina FSU 941]|nr:hypothetical protein K501DRAFT_217548 [Backusella circina FSU 941]
MKPARTQVTQAQLDEYLKDKRPEGGTYNIWHHRYSGLERDFNKTSVRPKFKVDIARDAGETIGSRNPNSYFCLFFAKGMCSKGAKCGMWHRVPTTEDHVETTVDCFGRDKYTDFRQDMGGVGGFLIQNRTLYVGRIAVTDDIEAVVRRQFGQFGPMEKVRILRNKGVAFVTYNTRGNAEFAREAMMNQALDNNEIINVRWATADPNAIANRLDAQDDMELAKAQMLRAETVDNSEIQELEADLPAEYTQMKRNVDEDGFSKMESQAKRRKAEEEAKEYAYHYDAQAAENMYGYVQYNDQQQVVEEEEKGIIPQNVLANLKNISKGVVVAADKPKVPVKSNAGGGLGSLANYGSDSEEED